MPINPCLMNHRSIILFIAAMATIVLFFVLPFNNGWLYTRVMNDEWAISTHVGKMDLEDRKIARYGGVYTMCRDIGLKLNKNALVLLPPHKLLRAMDVTELNVPEPAVLYYFSGIRSVTVNSPNPEQANVALIAKGNRAASLKQIDNKPYLDSLLRVYQKYAD